MGKTHRDLRHACWCRFMRVVAFRRQSARALDDLIEFGFTGNHSRLRQQGTISAQSPDQWDEVPVSGYGEQNGGRPDEVQIWHARGETVTLKLKEVPLYLEGLLEQGGTTVEVGWGKASAVLTYRGLWYVEVETGDAPWWQSD